MQGLAGGQLAPDEQLLAHLDNCLGCRACERACPSGVAYGTLLDATRARLAPRRRSAWHRRLLGRLGFGLIVRPRLLGSLAAGLRAYQRSGLQRLVRASSLLRPLGLADMERRLPPLTHTSPLRRQYPAAGVERGRVALFTGCLGPALDGTTLHDAVRLLTRLGYAVDVPARQACCGALHQHAGQPEAALALARRNLDAFAGAETILYLASGCGAQLSEYAKLTWPPVEANAAADLAGRVREIGEFLDACDWSAVPLTPVPGTVAVHLPCTQRNVLRQPDSTGRLLRRVPELEVVPLAGNDRCCGAAGSHVLSHPAQADALRAPKLAALAERSPDWLASTNLGCALHLAEGLRRQGLAPPVVHPVTLLARALGD